MWFRKQSRVRGKSNRGPRSVLSDNVPIILSSPNFHSSQIKTGVKEVNTEQVSKCEFMRAM